MGVHGWWSGHGYVGKVIRHDDVRVRGLPELDPVDTQHGLATQINKNGPIQHSSKVAMRRRT